MIELQHVSFTYEKDLQPTLQDINFTMPAGQWVAVIGANGSGKSTLARCLNGLLLPQQGTVLVDGLNAAAEEECLRVRQAVSFVFQNPDNQIVATSVEDDIAFGLENLGLPRDEITRRVEAALQTVEMTAKRDKAPHLLSGGEKQRVALAGAIAMASRYLVLDEPTSMLDPQMRAQVMQTIRMLHREHGMGVFYVTNLMQEALLAERVIVLSQGRIVRDDTPAAVFSDPAFLEQHALALPSVCRISAYLAQAGWPQAGGAMNLDDLVEKLCTLH